MVHPCRLHPIVLVSVSINTSSQQFSSITINRLGHTCTHSPLILVHSLFLLFHCYYLQEKQSTPITYLTLMTHLNKDTKVLFLIITLISILNGTYSQ
ncbi:hypothetical protein BDF14DRAFT_1803317 [Spinellus fusiger]|nr:hypothetical protein BDF14DRAFT_1803317 [Spinellus fusiger]